MSLPDDFADAFAGVPESLPQAATVTATLDEPVTDVTTASDPVTATTAVVAGIPAPRSGPVMGPTATDLPDLERPDLPDLGEGLPSTGDARDLRLLAEVQVELAVELGRVKLPLRDLLSLGPGAVLELDRAADAPVDVLVNGCLVARGEVVVIDGQFGVRVTAVVER
ncbi:MAG: flagellar motor switch protein FliN [Mycobacteriales bacterium]|nr:flagellar motor switch protein FliN [Mycobacteriales bacterium]